MRNGRSAAGDTSMATTVAGTLSIAALIVGVAVFGAVVSDDDPDTTETSASAVPAESTAAVSESAIDFSAAWDDGFVARDPALAGTRPDGARDRHERN